MEIVKKNMISEDNAEKLKRMRILERERKQRIFNDKQRLIGVDKQALDEQVRERKQIEAIQQRDEELMQKNLITCSLKAMEKEQIMKHLAYKDAEYQRQLQNILLAKEQRYRNRVINQEPLTNIPTEDYYNYFNTSSR